MRLRLARAVIKNGSAQNLGSVQKFVCYITPLGRGSVAKLDPGVL